MGYKQRLKALGLHSLEIRMEIGDLKQAFKIPRGLTLIRSHTLNDALILNRKTICECMEPPG